MRTTRRIETRTGIALAGLLLLAAPGGRAAGTVQGRATVNGKASPLVYAAATTVENLFDEKKRDVVVLLADRPVPPELVPDDEVGISMRARNGDFRAIMLRIDAAPRLVNVKLFDQGIQGFVIFAAKDFELLPGKVDAKGAAGRVHTRAPASFSGVTLELDATFEALVAAVASVAAPAADARPEPRPSATPDRSAALNQLLAKRLTLTPADFLTAVSAQQVDTVKLFLDAGMSPDTPGGPGTPLFAASAPLVWAIMMQNTPMALALIRAGANVQKPDANGMAPLTWATEVCAVPVMQALVDAKADVNYKRAGITMLQEAGACPAGAALLRKAGAK